MPPVWQALSSMFRRVFDRTCVRPLSVALHDATGRYAVRKAGLTSVQRAASARAPGLNVPALNFEVRVAYSSSIAHPGLAAMRCPCPFGFRSRHSIILASGCHRPDHTRHLVRERHGRDHLWFAHHERGQPTVWATTLPDHPADDAHAVPGRRMQSLLPRGAPTTSRRRISV